MNYFNENDPKTAAWLRALIAEKLIPDGFVDERSIADVRPQDLYGYEQCHFFAGIAGWPLALHLAGWPEGVPVWTGSCPCQPFSAAGKGQGTKDKRHLWPEFERLIAECGPEFVFGEQVASKAGREWLSGVRLDLEALGYAVGAADLCAAGTGPEGEGWFVYPSGEIRRERIKLSAPHIRQRLFWVAYRAGERSLSSPFGGIHRREEISRSRNGESERCGDAGRLEHTEGDGREQGRAESVGGSVASGCGDGDGGVGNSSVQSCERDSRSVSQEKTGIGRAGQCDGNKSHRSKFADTSMADGLGDSSGAGPQKRIGNGRTQRSPVEPKPWEAFELASCRDGKIRRIPIEPEFFPLAHGVPGRVGLLRGYGNAIVPQIAAEFIQAFLEAIQE